MFQVANGTQIEDTELDLDICKRLPKILCIIFLQIKQDFVSFYDVPYSCQLYLASYTNLFFLN